MNSLWKPENGITQGFINSYLNCRMKTYNRYIRGIGVPQSSVALDFGTLVHAALEDYFTHKDFDRIPKLLERLERDWENQQPRSAEELQTFQSTMALVTPVVEQYIPWFELQYSKTKWVGLEQEFNIPYSTSVGETFLRGKIDGILEIKGELWLFETKTKGLIPDSLVDWIPHGLQVLFYSYAVKLLHGRWPKGVIYNVIRRPGLRLGKSETVENYAKRVTLDISSRLPYYFMVYQCTFQKPELIRFQCDLHDLLTEIMVWDQSGYEKTWKNTDHCIQPWGSCMYLRSCSCGDESNLSSLPLYPELEEK